MNRYRWRGALTGASQKDKQNQTREQKMTNQNKTGENTNNRCAERHRTKQKQKLRSVCACEVGGGGYVAARAEERKKGKWWHQEARQAYALARSWVEATSGGGALVQVTAPSLARGSVHVHAGGQWALMLAQLSRH